MAKQIKPFVEELSLARNPAIRKTFYMTKEDIMSKSVEILQDAKVKLSGEKEIKKVVTGMSKESQSIFLDSLKLMQSCKDVPKSFFSTISSSAGDDIAWITSYVDAPIDLEKEREKIRKEEKPKIEKEVREEMGKDENKVMKEMNDKIVVLEKTLETTRTELKTTKKDLSDEKTSRQLIILEKEAVELGAVGDEVTEVAKTLLLLDKTDKEGADRFRKSMKAMKEKLASAGLFQELGGAGGGANVSSAFEFLQKEVDAIMTKDYPDAKDIGKAREKAWRQVAKTYPEKFKEYLDEQARKSQ
jgi:hypothetical protein